MFTIVSTYTFKHFEMNTELLTELVKNISQSFYANNMQITEELYNSVSKQVMPYIAEHEYKLIRLDLPIKDYVPSSNLTSEFKDLDTNLLTNIKVYLEKWFEHDYHTSNIDMKKVDKLVRAIRYNGVNLFGKYAAIYYALMQYRIKKQDIQLFTDWSKTTVDAYKRKNRVLNCMIIILLPTALVAILVAVLKYINDHWKKSVTFPLTESETTRNANE